MRARYVPVLLLFSFFLTASSALGQVQVGPFAGINFDGTEILVGGQARFPVGLQLGETDVLINPSLEFYPFIDSSIGTNNIDFSLWVLNADALLPIEISDSFDSYAGAGLYFARSKWNFNNIPGLNLDDSEVNAGLNLFAGATFQKEDRGLIPFGEVRLALGDGSSGLILRGGVLVSIGGN
jgi:opacity protein-like surface antigen